MTEDSLREEIDAGDWSDIIPVNRDVLATIEAYRGSRLAGSPAPRTMIAFSIDAVANAKLIGLIAANLKGSCTLRIVDIRVPLPDEDEEPAPDAPARPQARLLGIEADGSIVPPHEFEPWAEDALQCARCGTGASNPIHEGAAINNYSGLADRMIADLDGGEGGEQADNYIGRHNFVASLEDFAKCAACKLPTGDPVHNMSEGEGAGEDLPLNELSEEQTSARHRLANRSKVSRGS